MVDDLYQYMINPMRVSDPEKLPNPQYFRNTPLFYSKDRLEYVDCNEMKHRIGKEFLYVSDVPYDTGEKTGMEYEIPWNPTAIQKDMARKLLLAKNEDWNAQYYVRRQIFGLSQFVYAMPHSDGGGTEFLFVPMTLESFKVIYPWFEEFFSYLESMGFTSRVDGAGIHLNFDYGWFGGTNEERVKTLQELLIFMFENREFYFGFSGRQGTMSSWSDPYEMLSKDIATRLNPLEMRRIFQQQKIATLEEFKNILDPAIGIKNTKVYDTFKIRLGIKEKPRVELRHFGSTLNPRVLRIYWEGSAAIIKMCRNQPGTNSLQDLVDYVRFNIKEFPFFFQYLCENKMTRYMINSTAIKTA